jgi:hypothetical protein
VASGRESRHGQRDPQTTGSTSSPNDTGQDKSVDNGWLESDDPIYLRYMLEGSEPDDDDVGKRLAFLRVDQEAKRILRNEKAQPVPVPDDGDLTHDLAEPDEDVLYTVDELFPHGGNGLVVASYKVGKTTLALNLIKALADGEPFLGRFPVQLDGRVCYWNYEMNAAQVRRWFRDLAVQHPERVARPWHLRGYTLRIWEDGVRAQVVEWLRRHEVKFWIVDPAARAWSGLVVNENDNSQMEQFTTALDTVKREAEISDLLLVTHQGRQQFDDDQERSRGATRLEDWMDFGWYYTKDRFLRATGRDVDVAAFKVDGDKWRLRAGAAREEHRLDDGVRKVCEKCLAEPGITGRPLEQGIPGDKTQRPRWIKEAVGRGFVEQRDGARRAKHHYITEQGRKFLVPYLKAGTSNASRSGGRTSLPPKGTQGRTPTRPSGTPQGREGRRDVIRIKKR